MYPVEIIQLKLSIDWGISQAIQFIFLNLHGSVLRHNELTSLPEDLTRDAPSLRTLNVASNKIRSFNEESFQHLKENQNATVNLEGICLQEGCRPEPNSAKRNARILYIAKPCTIRRASVENRSLNTRFGLLLRLQSPKFLLFLTLSNRPKYGTSTS